MDSLCIPFILRNMSVLVCHAMQLGWKSSLTTFHTDANEEAQIASSESPIHVFWHNQMKVRLHKQWPEDRKWPAVRHNSHTWAGVFVLFYCDAPPDLSIGRAGDLWVNKRSIYSKTTEGLWRLWNKKDAVRCPYDESLQLTWSAHAHFKYLTKNSTKTETSRWKKGKYIKLSYSAQILTRATCRFAKEAHPTRFQVALDRKNPR
jgi:hypothetical protein